MTIKSLLKYSGKKCNAKNCFYLLNKQEIFYILCQTNPLWYTVCITQKIIRITEINLVWKKQFKNHKMPVYKTEFWYPIKKDEHHKQWKFKFLLKMFALCFVCHKEDTHLQQCIWKSRRRQISLLKLFQLHYNVLMAAFLRMFSVWEAAAYITWKAAISHSRRSLVIMVLSALAGQHYGETPSYLWHVFRIDASCTCWYQQNNFPLADPSGNT